jgi:hypothetical protein
VEAALESEEVLTLKTASEVTDTVEGLSRIVSKLIPLERQAYNLNDAPPDKPDSDGDSPAARLLARAKAMHGEAQE